MTTDTRTVPAVEPADIHPAWHATALPARDDQPAGPDPDTLNRAARRVGAAGTWLLAAAIVAGLIRAATGADPYRGGLAVLAVALVAAVLWGVAERLAARADEARDVEGGD